MTIKNILVVDDSPTERAALAEILARNNFAVTMAENGEEAITKAKERTPDLILMDVVMPGLNGFQATRTLSGDAATKPIPIIICTAGFIASAMNQLAETAGHLKRSVARFRL
jgi:twitching motility two-component system response regulator PilH